MGEGPRVGPHRGSGSARAGLAGQRRAQQAAWAGGQRAREGEREAGRQGAPAAGTRACGDLRAEGHGPLREGQAGCRSR